jgi:hypothetical protein
MSEARPAKRKVIGLGLSRTGMLGYSAVHFPWPRLVYGKLAAYAGFDRLALDPGVEQRFDALVDTSVLPVWKRLDAAYPGARFVLTIREKGSWLHACSRFAPFQPGTKLPLELRALRRRVYGCVYFDRGCFAAAYDRHHADVYDHFRGRERDLLTLDVCGGEGFGRLCPFLGETLCRDPFPWVGGRSTDGARTGPP